MDRDSERCLIGLTHEACARVADAAAMYEGAHHSICGFKVFVRAAEMKLFDFRNSENFEIEFEAASLAFEQEVQEEKYVVVRHLMYYSGTHRGEVVQCTETMGQRLEMYGIARIITEEEAVEYGRRRRETSGGWMDSPKWRPFVASYKRIRTAVYSRTLTRLDTTTQASKAA